MAALKLAATALALCVGTIAQADPVARWEPYIAEASVRFGLPSLWIEHVLRAESGGWTHIQARPMTSHAGAMGLMQLMPITWAQMRDELRLGPDPYDPHDNILAGSHYLRLMYDRFGYPGLFAAYNSGPGCYADYLARRRSLPGETRAYLANVVAGVERSPSPQPKSLPPLFFTLSPFGKGSADRSLFAIPVATQSARE